MLSIRILYGTILFITGFLLFSGNTFPETKTDYAPQDPKSVPHMLDISWSEGPPMPQGLQDNLVVLVQGNLISVGGFCGGYDNDWKPGKYPRGFLNKTWTLDLAHQGKGWLELPPFPGAARQALEGASVNNALYVWGGFNYTSPYAYRDGYCLSRKNTSWEWTPLPPLPASCCWSGTCVIGSCIYSLGGCDYDGERFYTLTDRTKKIKQFGCRMMKFDTRHPEAGWQFLSPCPGSPRAIPATVAIAGNIYFIGGIAADANGVFCNVVDSWRYTPATDTWKRLRDMPVSGTGTNTGLPVYKDRYILLPCGYQYKNVLRPDGTKSPQYGLVSTVKRTWENHPREKGKHYFNHCYVYDIQTDLYGRATALPFDDVASITLVIKDTAWIFPGETAGFYWEGEYFGHHPEFVLKGHIRERPWQQKN